jgi:hypothetical protein
MSSIEVCVVRSGQFYFYSRWCNGVQDVCGKRISVERAREIVEASDEASEVLSRGGVSFDVCEDIEFSFLAKWAGVVQ